MDYKDLITIVLSSSVISAFVSKIFDFWDKRQEQKRVINERRYNDKKEERQQLKEIYANAIHIIQLIKNGFYDRTLQQASNAPFGSSAQKKKYEEFDSKIEKINNLMDSTAPLLRLYATKEICELFSRLTKYSKFSYSKNVVTQFILYSFDRDFTYMCQLMQKSLGIISDNPRLLEAYICPYCGNTHNSEEDCPFCSISWVNAIDLDEKFNKDCENDEILQQLLNDCQNKGKNPLLLMPYPINKDEWIEKIKEFLDMSDQKES